MTNGTTVKTEVVTNILNCAIDSFNDMVPLDVKAQAPQVQQQTLELNFGVLIGITGDTRGSLILAGSSSVFSKIGEQMYGMSLEGEMLSSFSGELGNMIAGGMSTKAEELGTRTDITSPTIMEGNTSLKGYKKGLHIPIIISEAEELSVYLLLDS
ncbi:chemotaxis protein CheX [Salinibacillus kushneri]|uniref:Chemotaxis protein CheX n=1 Tax=Salinibacillus kushneri TaxID=237682 RepID=A0A1I0EPZ4_9BACI|nr:chemotaxis protein CheX [Salinibacillus kushneri]SET47512.1 chemotaxis protein CheX [Salinibacillus kushneri]